MPKSSPSQRVELSGEQKLPVVLQHRDDDPTLPLGWYVVLHPRDCWWGPFANRETAERMAAFAADETMTAFCEAVLATQPAPRVGLNK
jgi:hypothetical protein